MSANAAWRETALTAVVLFVPVTLWLTLTSAAFGLGNTDSLLALTDLVLSWPLISGGLIFGFAKKFDGEIRSVMNALAGSANNS